MMPIAEINWLVCLLAAFLAGMKLQEHIHARRKAALIQIGRQIIGNAIAGVKGMGMGRGAGPVRGAGLVDVPQAGKDGPGITGDGSGAGEITGGYHPGGNEPEGQEGGRDPAREG